MSELSFMEKLLDGVEVEWKALDEISVKISSGGTPKTGVAEFYDGDIPWLRTQEVDFREIWDTGVKITEAGVKNSSAKWIPTNCIIVAMYGATVGKIGINKIPMTTNQACANIELDPEIADYRYVFHFLSSQYEYIKSLGAGSQTNINAGIVKKLNVPIPCPDNPKKSLEIQGEIVRILDAFTAMTAELTAELNLRKKQYNHYRDQLLSFEEGEVEWKTLGDLTTDRFWIMPATPKFNENEDIPYITSKNIRGGDIYFDKVKFISRDDFNNLSRNRPILEGDFLISMIGTIGEIARVKKSDLDFYGQNMYLIRLDESLLHSGYFLHFFDSPKMKSHFNSVKNNSGQGYLKANNIDGISVPVPPLPEQKRLATILDKFDALTNSITEGLPREIELRQKQYEYYRDLLLSFPKPDAEVAA